MTTTTRICLDMLTSARTRREEYVGPWLPEPVVDTAALAPDSRTELAEDLSIALLLTLDRLSPLERAAFLLHDVFDFSFSEVATALERSEAACRQLAARARAHVRAVRPRGATAPPRPGEIDAKHAQLLSAFMAAIEQMLAAHGWQINTAFIERVNLAIRQHVAAIGRRVMTLCQGEDGLRQQLTLYHTYYNFCLPHTSCAYRCPNLNRPTATAQPNAGSRGHQPWRQD
jgi:hypothetical protein